MRELLLIGESGFLGKELKKELIKAKNYNVSGTSKNVSSKHYFNLNERHNLKLEKYSVVTECVKVRIGGFVSKSNES